jgi:hypothetical protein
MMKNLSFTLIALIFLLYSCNSNPPKDNKTISKILQSSDNVDDNFELFIKHFSEDSVFQISRITFPFKQTITGIEDEKDSIRLINMSEFFEKFDFRTKEYNGRYDKWKQFVKIDGEKAVIQIRGIDNGIFVDYYFEKKNGRWTFLEVIDSST